MLIGFLIPTLIRRSIYLVRWSLLIFFLRIFFSVILASLYVGVVIGKVLFGAEADILGCAGSAELDAADIYATGDSTFEIFPSRELIFLGSGSWCHLSPVYPSGTLPWIFFIYHAWCDAIHADPLISL